MRRFTALLLASVLAVGLAGCGDADAEQEKVDPATAEPGAYSEGSDVFVVYPEDAGLLPVEVVSFTAAWEADMVDFGLSEFAEEDGGVLTSSRVDDELRVWMDVAVDGDSIEIAQLSIENRATDVEDHLYVDEIFPAFASALGLTELPAELGLDDVETLFEEGRTAVATVDGITLYLAMNKWTLVLGASGG